MNKLNNFECSPGCRSQRHGAQITAAIIRGTDLQAIAYMKNICHRCHLVTDSSGKSALHTASSCGKRKVVRWLLAQGVPLNQKDTESGYTPLHRALFYGHVQVAVALIKAGANISSLDYDALTPLDHINFDRPNLVSFTFSLPKHVYVWGSNSSYNLGQAHQCDRTSPGWLELFQREGQIITDVALNKFHTLFLATSGRVYACGLGHGGRLGLDITSPVVTPRLVKGLLQNNVIKVSTGPNHSMFLTDTGQVWTCGTNSHHQLGLNPPPETVYTPKLLTWHKNHKDEVIVGIGAARYHSVIWTSRVLYSFGLNAGQLGHFKNDNEHTIINPRSVTSIVLREEGTLACVGVSDGATVVSTSFGDVYVLHQYQTRKVASRMLGVVKVACTGGHLDSRVGPEGLTEKGGTSLKIAVLIGGGVGHLYLWTEETAHLSRCLFTINRKINLTDFCLNVNSLAIVTDEGEAFSAIVLPQRESKATDKVLGKPWGPSGKFNEFVDRSSCIVLRLTRIVALHRTVAIMCDPKGRNFAALQNDPNSFLLDVPQISKSSIGEDLGNLLQETVEEDSVHDIIIECGGRKFPAHSYILAHHSLYFRELILEEGNKNDDTHSSVQKVCGSLQDSEKKCIIISDIRPEIFQEVLKYIYSGFCQLTTLGQCQFKVFPDTEASRNSNDVCNDNHIFNRDLQYPLTSRQNGNTANKDEKLQSKNSNNKKKKKTPKNIEAKNKPSSIKRPLEISHLSVQKKPLQLLYAAAKKLQITKLMQDVDKLELVDGCIQLKYGYSQRDIDSNKAPQYHREMFQELWDVMIQSKSGDVLGAHKCILAARLEYFHCMFSASWIEALSSKSLSMPLPTSILAILLDYLYEDDCPKLQHSKDVEFLCNVLIVADQFLISRLREICEVAIVGMLTLKNAGELLEFAVNYNSDQLKVTAMQFISLNLAAMLENGSLLSVSNDVLDDLSEYYRQFIPRMSCRHLTPFEHPPYADELEQLLEENPLTLPDSDEDWDDLSVVKGDKQQSSTRKKKRIRRNSQVDSRTRKTSTSSQFSVSSSDCDTTRDVEDAFEALDFDDLEEREPSEFAEKSYSPQSETLVTELMIPLRTDTEIKSQNQDMTDLNSWKKVGKKRSTSFKETTRESPVKEDLSFKDISEIKSNQEVSSPKLSNTTDPIKSPVGSFESPETNFPSLTDSFTKSSKSSFQVKNSKINKLSQKQRKKQAAEAAAAAAVVETEKKWAAGEAKSAVAPSCGWGTPPYAWGSNSHTNEVSENRRKSHTLADIIKAEEASVKAKQVSSPINIMNAKKSYGSGATGVTPTKKGWGIGATPPTHQWNKDCDESGAWSTAATSPLSSPVLNIPSPGSSYPFKHDAATPCFSKILKEEETHMGNLLRERCKPLSLIQLEDKAIEELYAFYGAHECFEENIKVSRVRTALANPTWKKS
ncbi:inhibitor of Bruton tyrosine kinase [Palaemon carinicauda]|uniref:inhibitor of Bruton tyrosine kinase n=1 Tax=Palaemon carinicauda TaxID=392227 RepID=UPI0035B60E5A